MPARADLWVFLVISSSIDAGNGRKYRTVRNVAQSRLPCTPTSQDAVPSSQLSLALFHRTERFEFRAADFPELEVWKRSSGPSLNLCDYFGYGISYRNFCLLGVFLEVQSVKSTIAHAELAHTLNTPKLSPIAKKLLVTIARTAKRPLS
jgi:hypothetical protein